MSDTERQTRSHLMRKFQEHGFHPRTHLGQNFLIDLNIIEFVVRHADLNSNDLVLEIGAGTGGMTTFMAREAGHVVSVEVDRDMHQLASDAIAPYDNVTLIRQDALKNKNTFAPEIIEEIERRLRDSPEMSVKLVANLPYSIATPVISNLVATEIPWTRMVVTIQYELGLRMQARPKQSHYGALSVWLQSQCDVEMLKQLGPTVFWPRPKVDSAIMKIVPNEKRREKIQDRAFFQDFIRRLFGFRRKFMRSVLVGMYRKQLTKQDVDDLLTEMDLPLTLRAEQLDVPTLVELGNKFQTRLASME
ncbi:Ribosomal RNA small subunit methyltransferase A [Thalassoglobus neptunius]|uniref:Ribosomal RNA small subunit methyltransferase A n=1 Tax=Thalassoglobus neptunius TaxID=1938619 RepID=A0A5C5X5E0_9PLAN|nr:16S rRNA (adenine(1518)-N(6)/adenine(1519)-N(6))-dimethyltransferase RsmA [Thalassoglobus neptunius]TWT57435.1 Ribosomal RNA small subunit methyltransferase A [Thalassoglobus neptunius]